MKSEEVKQVMKAIIDNAKATSSDPSLVLREVADGTMIVIDWDGKLVLVYNSPNGL